MNPKIFFLLLPIAFATLTDSAIANETATLRVSIEGGASNSKFKFSDASKGCPEYHESSLK